ncbi:hypothetical protein OUZ56_030342 [Daphnia magna]|uniref:Cytoplasmic dynein 1 intermediate chain n=1 Tax=Daphnia magna TaxID=35525 RepID=A0ABQ9ZR07_9CRUS|nr:hypothetical protein OUZ56_030342 [Daphnia magna]
MADRKAELGRQRAKLDEMRKDRERRQQERERQEVENSHQVLREGDQNVTMDELLKREGLKPVLDVLSTYVPSTQEPSNQSTPDSSLVQSPLMKREIRKKPQLTKVSVQTTDIPPKEIVTYAKQTQTVASPERGAHQVDYYGVTMADRKAELERRRAKLEELRKEKQRRQQERERQEVENSHRVLREGDQNVTMDELLKREGLKPVSDVLATYVPSTQEPSNQSTTDSSLVQSPFMTQI